MKQTMETSCRVWPQTQTENPEKFLATLPAFDFHFTVPIIPAVWGAAHCRCGHVTLRTCHVIILCNRSRNLLILGQFMLCLMHCDHDFRSLHFQNKLFANNGWCAPLPTAPPSPSHPCSLSLPRCSLRSPPGQSSPSAGPLSLTKWTSRSHHLVQTFDELEGPPSSSPPSRTTPFHNIALFPSLATIVNISPSLGSIFAKRPPEKPKRSPSRGVRPRPVATTHEKTPRTERGEEKTRNFAVPHFSPTPTLGAPTLAGPHFSGPHSSGPHPFRPAALAPPRHPTLLAPLPPRLESSHLPALRTPPPSDHLF